MRPRRRARSAPRPCGLDRPTRRSPARLPGRRSGCLADGAADARAGLDAGRPAAAGPRPGRACPSRTPARQRRLSVLRPSARPRWRSRSRRGRVGAALAALLAAAGVGRVSVRRPRPVRAGGPGSGAGRRPARSGHRGPRRRSTPAAPYRSGPARREPERAADLVVLTRTSGRRPASAATGVSWAGAEPHLAVDGPRGRRRRRAAGGPRRRPVPAAASTCTAATATRAGRVLAAQLTAPTRRRAGHDGDRRGLRRRHLDLRRRTLARADARSPGSALVAHRSSGAGRPDRARDWPYVPELPARRPAGARTLRARHPTLRHARWEPRGMTMVRVTDMPRRAVTRSTSWLAPAGLRRAHRPRPRQARRRSARRDGRRRDPAAHRRADLPGPRASSRAAR